MNSALKRFWLNLKGIFSPYPKGLKNFQRVFITLFLFLSITPIIVLTWISYYKYKNLIREDSLKQAHLYTYNAKHTIESYLNQLKNTVLLISEIYSFEELSNPKTLDYIFEQLKKKYEGLVDISVIGPDGIQIAYSGPFNLLGKDYSESFWYQKVLTRKVYISEVFLGYRNVPHFIIAVSQKLNGKQQYWVLRASIDKETLDRFLRRIKTDEVYNAFLINEKREVQSSILNLRFNQVYTKFEDLPYNEKEVILKELEVEDKYLVRSLVNIQDTPWFLVIDRYNYQHKPAWNLFLQDLITICTISIVLLIPMSIYLGIWLTRLVKKFEDEREAVLIKAEQTNRLASLGRLSAGVAHEINNPLAIINEKVGLIKDLLAKMEDIPYKDKLLKQIEGIKRAIERAKFITYQLLEFARKMSPKLDFVQINEVIEECVGFLEKEASYYNIRFEKKLQPDLPLVLADYGQMQQVFFNLINNAIDAIIEAKRQEGVIKIKTSQLNENFIEIVVQDNGIGMPPEMIKRVFEPFFTTKLEKEKKGTGLGLFITYEIIEKFGGTILVESEKNKETTFKILLPVKTDGGSFYEEKA
uniref:histidine kinase n=1 Tax=Thermodesulfobacterium geofontis TaxID=1295609 RepID=A0A7V5XH31_9BACT